MGKPLLKMLLGALAGLVVWLIMEPFAPKALESSEWEIYSVRVLQTLGMAIGLVLGAFSGWQQGGRLRILLGFVLGGLFGFIGARLGMLVGTFLVQHTIGEHVFNTGNVILAIPARIMALTPVGTFVGAGIGLSTLNWRRGLQGVIGGTIGGGLGAALFDPISLIFASVTIASKGLEGQNAEVGIFGRALYCVLLGAFIGLFIGLIEQVSRTAWVRLRLGRNEGKEWAIDSPQVLIGRNEMAGIPLFGDPAIEPYHAMITRRGPNDYWLSDRGTQSGTYLNGQRITEVPLYHGAVFQVGGSQLEFLMKVGSAPQRAAEALRAQQAYPLQGQVPVAPFAGGYPQPVYPQPIPAPGGAAAMPLQQPFVQTSPAPVPVQPATSVPTLVATTGPLTGTKYTLSSVLEAGREAAGISLSFDQTASRRHASFTPGPAGIMVSDLGSTNGVFVNGQQVQAAILAPGDLVRVGVTTFRVE